MRTLALRRTLLVSLALALAACEQILGFPDEKIAGTGGAGGGATSSTTSSTASSSSSSSGTGGSGGADGGVCEDGATQPCYDGPAGTEGVGACAAGVQTCAGMTWGACMGATLPAVENCTTPDVDESCDGIPTCTGAYRWAKRFGDASGQYANGVAIDANGNVVVVGRVAGAVDFGGGALNSMNGSVDAFIAVLDARGNHVWSSLYGADQAQEALAVATDADANIVVVGSVVGSIDFGGGMLTSFGNKPNGFVAELDASGNYVWSTLLGDVGLDAVAVGVDAMGDVLVAGQYQGMPDFGAVPLPAALDNPRAFVAKLAKADGHTLWAQAFMGNAPADTQTTTALAVTASGDVVVAVNYTGTLTPPNGTATSCVNPASAVLELSGVDGTATWVWGTCDPTPGSAHLPSAVGIDPSGDVFVAGSFAGTIDLGVGGPRPSAGSVDVFLAKIDGGTGAPLIGAVFGDVNAQRALSVAIDAAGNVTIAGPSAGAVDFGGGPVATTGNGAFLAKFDDQIGYVWSRGFSDETGMVDSDVATALGYRALATFPTGDLAWATGFTGATDLGGGMLVSQGANDVLVGVLAP